MYDFCFSFPYAGLLFIGGLSGFITKGSAASLAVGIACGGLITLFGRASLHFYHQGRLCKPATMASMFISAFVGMVMFHRYDKTGKVFPGLVGAVISGCMTMFYMWSFFLGPEPKVQPRQTKQKKEKKEKKEK